MSVTFSSECRGVLLGSGRSFRSRGIFMLVDDKLRFVINHNVIVPASPWPSDDNLGECQRITSQLIQTNGQYFRLHGIFDDPFEFLNWMQANGYVFARESRYFMIRTSHGDFTDVSGNLLQYSSAFSYRFYDEALLARWVHQAQQIDPDCLNPTAA